MPLRIEDYALIGDCESAALVGRDGSIDWLCLPRFDAGACFAALLGGPDNGRWLIAPAGGVRRVRRRYRPGTLILETTFETGDGTVTLVDCMSLRDETADVVRIVVGEAGAVPMRSELTVRFDYGAIVPWVRRVDDALVATAGPDSLYYRTPVEHHGENLHTVSEFRVAAGDRVPFTLTWQPSHLPPPPAKDAEADVAATDSWWSAWTARCRHESPWREAALRSLVVLKALTYAPTGGVIAAPTTSLPEALGGARNWDYRYCWLRDATFTLYALMSGGYAEEAAAWREWLVRAVAGDPTTLQIMYGIGGERRLTELELDWLPGYEGSAPVRIGNAAHAQPQLDVYGEVMDALHAARRNGLPPDDNAWNLQRALMDHLESAWEQPDAGIWEMRGPRRQFTHSKVMAWVAVDRAIAAVERFHCPGDIPLDRWRALRRRIHDEVCRGGWDEELGSFVQSFGSKALDASLLMLPLVGFLPADDPRIRGTVARIEQHLTYDGFVRRYDPDGAGDGLSGGEGTFLMCTFWLVDNLALQGRRDEAVALFERLLALRNDVGLLAEEWDPAARRMLGNFPQAFSHVAIVNSATNLARDGSPSAHVRHG
jgi:GH15 family glucan-1,4-alpha-glucosidase